MGNLRGAEGPNGQFVFPDGLRVLENPSVGKEGGGVGWGEV